MDTKWWVSIRTGQICILWSKLFRILASTQRRETMCRDQTSCHKKWCCVINTPDWHLPQVWWRIPSHSLCPQGCCRTSVSVSRPWPSCKGLGGEGSLAVPGTPSWLKWEHADQTPAILVAISRRGKSNHLTALEHFSLELQPKWNGTIDTVLLKNFSN